MTDDARLIYGEWDGLEPSEHAALQRRLEGEPALRQTRQQAQRLRADLRALGPHGTHLVIPPLDLDRLAAHRPPVARRRTPWLAAAAALLAGLGGWWTLSTPESPESTDRSLAGSASPAPTAPVEAPTAVGPEAEPDIAVAFQLDAPAAHAVTVAGDFNDWRPESLSMRQTAEGLWTARTALPPGRYAYMYVVDGQWITPPDARRTQDDGFGARNGVLDLLEPSDA